MTFSQIPYHRADLAAWKAQVEDQTKRFKEATTFEEADKIFQEFELSSVEFDTMVSLASIRRDIDTRDEFYDAEDTYYDQQMPTLQPAFKAWTTATLESPFRAQLEEKYGSVHFINEEMATKTFSPEIVEDMQKENALRSHIASRHKLKHAVAHMSQRKHRHLHHLFFFYRLK